LRELHGDILIAGGGVGGCAAALAAARLGYQVILTEETDWIGGQLTSQAVPPDEHPWIEQFGCTRRYREFREGVRRYYRLHLPLTTEACRRWHLNPGNGSVSRICHDPRVALAVLYEMLAPYLLSGRVQLFLEHFPVSADTDTAGDQVRAVTFEDRRNGERRTFTARLFLDATELGDLLPLTGTEYVTGAESQQETGELHAVPGPAQPANMQALTYCFAIDFRPGENHVIERPEMYDFWRDYTPDLVPAWSGKLLDWTYIHPITLQPIRRPFITEKPGVSPLWTYRRITDRANFASDDLFTSDISLINWPQNDYWLGPIIDVDEETKKKHLYQAKQLSLSFLYWMQTEAPRDDGGYGYPEIRLRHDVVGTTDGLAKYPYIRESRRIKAKFTVLEQHVGVEARGCRTAEVFPDSVGIGYYRIDLHPSTGGNNYIDIASCPFQIPLGSLIPIRMTNLLPAAKNIGVTHITNGCYRLHPVEWNIGESAGYLAAYCLKHNIPPEAVMAEGHLAAFRKLLQNEGVELAWPVVSV